MFTKTPSRKKLSTFSKMLTFGTIFGTILDKYWQANTQHMKK